VTALLLQIELKFSKSVICRDCRQSNYTLGLTSVKIIVYVITYTKI